MASRRKFLCLDCGIDTGKISEFYFINTQLWLSVMPSIHVMACVGCLEKRLGRKLQLCDFTDCYINDPKKNAMSIRLQERLTA